MRCTRMYLNSRLLAKRDTSQHIMNQRLRLICLGAALIAAGCGAARTDSQPQQPSEGKGYSEEKAESKVTVVTNYKPMKFDMSGGGALSSNLMYASGTAPGGAMYGGGAMYANGAAPSGAMYAGGAMPGGAMGGGAMVATAAHPYAYEDTAAPASTYVIPNYAEEHHAPNYGGGYMGVPHKTAYLPGHKYQSPGGKYNVNNSNPSDVSAWRRVIKVLAAAIPIGLFIAALPPNIVHINATQHTKPLGTVQKQRSGDDPDTIETFPVLDMIEKRGGLRALRNESCEANLFCEIARMGKSTEANAVQQAFWGIVNETPDSLAELLGTRELFKAIRTDACSIYKCPTV